MHPANCSCILHDAHVSGWFRAPACLWALQTGARKSNAGSCASGAHVSTPVRTGARDFCARGGPATLCKARARVSPPLPPPTHQRDAARGRPASIDSGTKGSGGGVRVE